ncbi:MULTISPECIES: tryptophan synthase subunit alpha [unclassified Corynebacterium]|uniref:tryptophan synthase subunit alpha n=1 Tax=unclassified Corynebacterium TaxID=2624378 RepID=UPI00264A5BA7|nr:MULTISPECIES: tryptophan synthase subunit alpha [unclassified Corynebacterium]MDN8594257.1 tryptophan synthase subunit alpha [Corynebacterium sp. P4_F2]WKK56759.1 tryptophan synthase subunit alpha [Corynebacterium sp. P4-C1]WKK64381.1 tryptophan synthase subunit alpha [Corynebacterium sp. P8-C1]
MSRFSTLFQALEAKNEGAFVPFVMLGDPSATDAVEIISTLVDAGADALELGIPFSDPAADGPTIQKSHLRGLDGGANVDKCFEQIREIRNRYPEIPIGMLVYANVPYVRGLDKFYGELHDAGADAVLIPDVPVREGAPFIEAATAAGIDPVFIAPAQARPEVLEGVAAQSRGYIYAVSRDGVTGAEKESQTQGLADVVANISSYDGAPVLLGFGISTPQHVSDAIAAGAAGAITGSAIAKIIDTHIDYAHPNPGTVRDMEALRSELREYTATMKQATIKS